MELKDKIKKTLKDMGRLPTSRVAAIVGVPHGHALKVMQKMWEDGEIVGEVETVATYWKLKEKKDANTN